MYDTILVPTDGSDVAEAAVEHAVELAATYDAEVHVLYVVDIDAVSYGLGVEQVDRIRQGHLDEMDELREKAEAATSAVAEVAAGRGVTVVEETRVGSPHEVIVEYADEIDSDVIVMGSHGRSGITRTLLGSVTERVLRSTSRPVFVAGRGEQ